MDAELWKNTSLIVSFMMRPILDDFIRLFCTEKKRTILLLRCILSHSLIYPHLTNNIKLPSINPKNKSVMLHNHILVFHTSNHLNMLQKISFDLKNRIWLVLEKHSPNPPKPKKQLKRNMVVFNFILQEY